MDSPRYIMTFVFTLTALVALLLTGLRQVTMEKANLNEEIFNKRAILMAVENYLPDGKQVKDLSDQDVVEIFSNSVEQMAIDREGSSLEGVMAEDIDMAKERKKADNERKWPVYVYQGEGGKTCYILSVRGNGLWDEIWGNVALESDLNTIAGVAFDHKAETPGLGAEIKDNPAFRKQFIGKQVFDNGEYVSILVKKGGAESGNPHQVDGITGATITSDGVTEMLVRGIRYYLPFLENQKGSPEDTQGMLIQEQN